MHDDAERQLYLSSFYHFAKYCLGNKDLVPHVHGKMCKAFEEETLRKLLCVPRGTMKSTVASVSYPMWRLLKNPNLRILLDSQLYTNSTTFLREIKGHYERNEKFRHFFGDWVGSVWSEGEIIVRPRTSIKKEPSIAASGIGAQKTSQHYDLIIADDLSSYDNCKTREHAEKVINHYRLYTSLLDPGGEIVVIGTRYSELDIIGFIIEHELGIKDGDLKLFKKALDEHKASNLRLQGG